jgi:REP element-mobilizing transposase RayT
MGRKRYIDNEHKISFYHIILKVPGNTVGNKAFAFENSHKKYFENLLFRLEDIYLIDLVSYCIMSNHAHLILARKTNILKEFSLRETAEKYRCYYQLKEIPDARLFEVRKFRHRLNDLSEFMRDLQRRFTFWYNNQFTERRRGSLWNPKFKSIVLASGKALSECMKYVELNPVRAKMVKSPGSYEFCSWSHIEKGDMRGDALRKNIIIYLRYFYAEERRFNSDIEVFNLYAGELVALAAFVKNNKDIKSIDPYMAVAFLQKSPLWNKSRVVGGEDELKGVGFGRKRPRMYKILLE